eukprot:TRINITY_DN10373_c1_g1_i1.p1 TRINITY_DN10373_c1_g1~~TRINITY_DN10373_c1_g1_i1.p1  ORF type:complete len:140 (-),score=30.03 TRINITY_DN10373_c1_g1_i1:12-431(-)
MESARKPGPMVSRFMVFSGRAPQGSKRPTRTTTLKAIVRKSADVYAPSFRAYTSLRVAGDSKEELVEALLKDMDSVLLGFESANVRLGGERTMQVLFDDAGTMKLFQEQVLPYFVNDANVEVGLMREAKGGAESESHEE